MTSAKPNAGSRGLAFVVLVAICTVPWALSSADSITWNVSGGGDWDTTTANWTGDSTTFTDDGTVEVTFDNTAGGTINIAPDMTPASVTVSAASGQYTFTGGPIDGSGGLLKTGAGTLKLGGTTVHAYTGSTQVSGGVLTIVNTNTLPAASLVELDGGTLRTEEVGDAGNEINIHNDIELTADSFIDVEFAHNTMLRGTISDEGGSFGFTKKGSRNVHLFGNNTYTGETIVENGTLYLRRNNNLGTADGSTTVQSGAQLSIETTGYSTPETVYLDGGTMRSSSLSSTVPRSWAGDVVLLSESDIHGKYRSSDGAAGWVQILGTVSGSGRLMVNQGNKGIVSLAGDNTHTGDTRAVQGTFRLEHTGALKNSTLDLAGGDSGIVEFDAPAEYTLGGLKGSRDLDMGGKTLSIGNNGQSTSYSGVLSNGTLTKIGSGTLTLSGANTHTGDTRVAAGTLRLANTDALQNSTLDLAAGDTGTVAVDSPAAFTFGGLKGTRGLDLGTKNLTVGGNGQSTTYSGDLTAGAITKIGGGTLTLEGANSHTGTLIEEGTIEYTTDENLGQAGAGITLGGGTLQYAGSGGLYTVSRSITLTDDSFLRNVGNAVRYSGKISDGAESYGFTLLSGPVYLSSATNDYDGETVVDGGTLYAHADGAFGSTAGGTTVNSGGTLTVDTDYTTSETLYLNGGIFRTSRGPGTTATWHGDVVLQDTARIRAKHHASGVATLKITGTISGDHDLRVGPGERGIVHLTGQNTYTGATTVEQGTLVVDGSIASSSGVTVFDGATLRGHGLLPDLGGAGLVSPGNSPGILTAPSVDPSAGLDFAFEFTSTGDPDYGNAADSVNDLFRLTDPSAPIAAPLDGDNQIDVYFNLSALNPGEEFQGGFFTDRSQGFSSLLDDAAFRYYVALDGNGPAEFEGVGYYPMDSLSAPRLEAVVRTVAATADFGDGAVDGYVMQLLINEVPEPAGVVLIVLGLACLGTLAGRPRRR